MSKEIHVYKGDEHRPRIETEFGEDNIFAEVYQKAERLLVEIIEETREDISSFQNQETFVGNNIVLFTADRGQGKTSAMMSFANFLRSPKENKGVMAPIDNAVFFLMDSIDPSAMYPDEDIIRVLLSRLFSCLNSIIKNDGDMGKTYLNMPDRNNIDKLTKYFQECYENLDSMEKGNLSDEYRDDLENLARLGDSANLKLNLYRLIELFLDYVMPKKEAKYLVVPIDDVDLCMGDVFRICEKIHNFLSLPNVIILMAIDYAQLGRTIYQKYLERYAVLLKVKKIDMEDECYSLAMKYLEKIFPGSHHIDLPIIDEVLTVQEERLHVRYGEREEKGNSDDVFAFKEGLSERLYQRTGIVILNKPGELHPFLPRTMRELAYFVKMLADMAVVDFDLVCSNIYGVKTPDESREKRRKEQIVLLRSNLQTVKQYFMEYWCTKHLDAQQFSVISDLDGLNHIARVSISRNVQRINVYLKKVETGNSIKAEDYQELMHSMDENSILQREEDFRQGLFLYYTLFLSEWFLAVLEAPQKMKAFLRFIGTVIYYSEAYTKLGEQDKATEDVQKEEDTSSRKTGLDGFGVTKFSLDIEVFRSYLGEQDKNAPSAELKKWMDTFCRSDAEGVEIIEQEQSKGKDTVYRWNTEIGTVHFDILMPYMRFFQNPTWEDTSKVILPGNKDLGSVIPQSSVANEGETKAEDWETNNQYIVTMKNIVTNCEVQKEIRTNIDEVCGKLFRRPQGITWEMVRKRLYETMENWVQYASYQGKAVIADMMKWYWEDVLKKYNYFEIAFLSNGRNMKRYTEVYELSLWEGMEKAHTVIRDLKENLETWKMKEKKAASKNDHTEKLTFSNVDNSAGEQTKTTTEDTAEEQTENVVDSVAQRQLMNLKEDYEDTKEFRPELLYTTTPNVGEECHAKMREIAILDRKSREVSQAYREIRQMLGDYVTGKQAESEYAELLKKIDAFLGRNNEN